MHGTTGFWTTLEAFAHSIESDSKHSSQHLHHVLDSFRAMPREEQEAARATLDTVLAELNSLRPLIRVLVAAIDQQAS
jgi:hypothetical protein